MSRRSWTQREMVLAFRPDLTAAQIGERLGRTPSSIYNARHHIRVDRRTERPLEAFSLAPITLDEHDACIRRCPTCSAWVYALRPCGTCSPAARTAIP